MLTTMARRVQSLAKENATLECETTRHNSVSAKNSQLRQAVEEVHRLEAENDELEVSSSTNRGHDVITCLQLESI